MAHAYLDASALVKWVIDEPESTPLAAALEERPKRFVSELALIEVPRAVRRAGNWEDAGRRTEQMLIRLYLVPIESEILQVAAALDPVALRTLDAIHVASARSLDLADLEFITYDDRLARAAEANGLKVVQPGR